MYHRSNIQLVKSLKNLVMNSVFILNASPIILLGKADLLNTVSPLADLWIVPEKVISEVEAKRPIASYLADLSHYSREFSGFHFILSNPSNPGILEPCTFNLGP